MHCLAEFHEESTAMINKIILVICHNYNLKYTSKHQCSKSYVSNVGEGSNVVVFYTFFTEHYIYFRNVIAIFLVGLWS